MKYTVPITWSQLLKLCKKMQADGIIPFSAVNDGGWPQMGMFDMLNQRINGYDFHISLLQGREDWTGPKVVNVFTQWRSLLKYYQPNANQRRWEDGADALAQKQTGMFLVGTWVTSHFEADSTSADQAVLNDLDFFAFPAINPSFAQEAVEAPIDGFLLAKNPKNPEGAKALLSGLASRSAIDAFRQYDPTVIATNSFADPTTYTYIQKKSAILVSNAKYVSQFLDRDTDPDFASKVLGSAMKDFFDGKPLKPILAMVEEQKATYTFYLR
jgi:multiple sugar transport system substrate-binding protein